MEISPLLSQKIFEGFFLPYIGVVASREQTFVPPTQGGSTKNLALIGQAVSEKMFEIVDDRGHTDGRQTMGIL